MAKKDEQQQNSPDPHDEESVEETQDHTVEAEASEEDEARESSDAPADGPELSIVSEEEEADVSEAAEEPETADHEEVAAEVTDDADAAESVGLADSEAEQTPVEQSETAVAADEVEELSTEQVIEALLFASDVPLPLSKLVNIVGVGSARDARKHIENLNARYAETGASFRIESIAGGYQMLTLPAFNTWLRRLKQTRQETKLSPAALETLAVVAYKQPVVRADIEAIRGVSAGEMLNRLREMGLVKIVGRAEDVGRPMLYGTTKRFLEVFGLAGLEDLPQVEEFGQPT